MADHQLFYYFMTALVGLLIGLAKGGLGGLLGTLATPMMALVMPAEQVVGLLLPMLIFADFFALASYWRKWSTRLVLLLLPGGILGVAIATLFITHIPAKTFRIVLAVIVLVFTLYKLFEKRIMKLLTYQGRNWHGMLAGSVAGFSSTLAHAGGPPVTIYLLLQRVTPMEFNATAALFFALLNWIKVPSYLVAHLFNWARLMQIAWLMPVIPLGALVGRLTTEKIDRVLFEKVIVVLLILSAVMLLLEK